MPDPLYNKIICRNCIGSNIRDLLDQGLAWVLGPCDLCGSDDRLNLKVKYLHRLDFDVRMRLTGKFGKKILCELES